MSVCSPVCAACLAVTHTHKASFSLPPSATRPPPPQPSTPPSPDAPSLSVALLFPWRYQALHLEKSTWKTQGSDRQYRSSFQTHTQSQTLASVHRDVVYLGEGLSNGRRRGSGADMLVFSPPSHVQTDCNLRNTWMWLIQGRLSCVQTDNGVCS